MNSITHIDIWNTPNPGAQIKNLIDTLDSVDTTLNEISCNRIVKRLVNVGGHKAVEYNAHAPQSNPQRSVVDFDMLDDYHGHISLVGPGAVYDEFGTGENGADDGHPMKGFYGLNPYNSGPFVSTHINKHGRHYWFAPHGSYNDYTYPNGYTEGIPSGKQMYNTLLYIRDIKDGIVTEEVNDAIKILK